MNDSNDLRHQNECKINEKDSDTVSVTRCSVREQVYMEANNYCKDAGIR